jgi:hypothetical protein
MVFSGGVLSPYVLFFIGTGLWFPPPQKIPANRREVNAYKVCKLAETFVALHIGTDCPDKRVGFLERFSLRIGPCFSMLLQSALNKELQYR